MGGFSEEEIEKIKRARAQIVAPTENAKQELIRLGIESQKI